jgi:hypothetical protein
MNKFLSFGIKLSEMSILNKNLGFTAKNLNVEDIRIFGFKDRVESII